MFKGNGCGLFLAEQLFECFSLFFSLDYPAGFGIQLILVFNAAYMEFKFIHQPAVLKIQFNFQAGYFCFRNSRSLKSNLLCCLFADICLIACSASGGHIL